METLENTVVKNGFCVGCGICATVKDSPFQVNFNSYGMYQASRKQSAKIEPASIMSICPFSSNQNENTIGDKLFENNPSINYDETIGYYTSIHAGHVIDDDFRMSCTSGGLVTWVIAQLFKGNYIDAVIHVKKPQEKKDVLYEYSISTNTRELFEGKKSRYYPVELSKILKQIKGDNKRYAIVGIPCFIKGLRLLIEKETGFSNIKYFIGIICGQLKSKYFADLFSMQYGIKHKNLIDIDFRVKDRNFRAVDYLVGIEGNIKGKSKRILTEPANRLFGTDWGFGALKYRACDVCDDVFNETADITFGDAWVEPYSNDWKGTNLVVLKDIFFTKILEDGVANKEIHLTKLSLEDAKKTQQSSTRHRKENLGLRLSLFNKQGLWIPSKRSNPSLDYSKRSIVIQKRRLKLSSVSHIAMKLSLLMGIFAFYKILLFPQILLYDYERFGITHFIPIRLKKYLKKLFKKSNN
jgi:coenzyme F420-reducing hydrogenase beta subunit